jgi:DNA-binding MarR family transcriptional regulator
MTSRKIKTLNSTDRQPNSSNDHFTARLTAWLDNSDISFGLRLAIMMNLIVRRYRQYKSKHKLPLMDWRVMMCIAAAPSATAQEIADFGGFDKMTISAALKRLKTQGRIARRADPSDRRRLLLELTPKGWALYGAMAAEIQLKDERLMAHLTAKEQLELRRFIDHFISALRVTNNS